MKSRSLLPHDSHLKCSINHHERADIKISKQIKPLSIISLYLALLMVFLVTSCASSSTKPRGEGIGFRLGTTNNKTLIKTTKKDSDATTHAAADQDVQSQDSFRFPVFYQFDETLLGNWAGGTTILDISQQTKENTPPALKSGTYGDIISQKGGEIGDDFDLDGCLTNIDAFKTEHPIYTTKIDAASNPSISADYKFTSLTLGYNVYVFYPSSPNHRWATVGVGLGAAYINGSFIVLLCDPYHIRLTKEQVGGLMSMPTYPGECRKKQKLTTVNINSFDLSTSILFKIYQYVGDEWEISVVDVLSPGTRGTVRGEEAFGLFQHEFQLDVINAVMRW